MCNRVRDPNQLELSELKLNPFKSRTWRQNIRGEWRPGSTVTVVISENGERFLDELVWGLIPNWSQSDRLEYSTHNARSETVATTASYRDAWRKGQRCLMPADGFYERGKFFRLREGGLMMMAAIWDEWKSPITGPMRSCSMLTASPNALVAPVHNRMPVIIGPEDWAKWLGEERATELDLRAMCRPYPAELMATDSPSTVRVRAPIRETAAQGSLF
jgi:putative SOS response-associated peptidase YedK